MKWQWAPFLMALAISILIDMIVAAAIVRYGPGNGDTESWVIAALMLTGGAIFFSVYGGIKGFVAVSLFKNERGAKAIAKMLANEGFPPARSYDRPDDYLSDIARNEDYEIGLRLRAEFLRGELAGMLGASGFSKGYGFQRTWERSIELLRKP